MTIEILRSHEDFVIWKTIFTWMLLNGLLVLVVPNFWNRQKKCQKKNWIFFEEVLHVSEEERSHTVSLQKCINEIHHEICHWSFPSFAAAQQTVFRYLWSRFYWGKQSIRTFAKDLIKTGNIASVLEPRNGKKSTSNEQMKKLFDSVELGRAESNNPAQLPRKT